MGGSHDPDSPTGVSATTDAATAMATVAAAAAVVATEAEAPPLFAVGVVVFGVPLVGLNGVTA